jgi:vacuolar protein sorting-associated protein 53
MVQDICSGIRSLDYAKRHITTTITGLKRIHMLYTGVQQLQELSTKRQYREVGKILEAVNQLSCYFGEEEKYKRNEKILQLTKSAEEIKETLSERVYQEFFPSKYKLFFIFKGRYLLNLNINLVFILNE